MSATTATYLVSSGTVTQTGQTYTSSTTDTSAVGVNGTGNLTLKNCTITTSGNTSSGDSSSFTGLNAGILVDTGGTLTMSGGSVTTTGTGANGIFAYSTGMATLSDVTVNCTGQLGHAVMCSGGGAMTISNLTALTTNTNAGAIATDRGGGTITVTGGTIKTTGKDSPAIYSTGTISVSGASLIATGSEAVVIEGLNTTTLTNCTAAGNSSSYGAVLVVQSTSGDASVGTATFSMSGGSLTANSGPLFFVTNTDAKITLTGVTVSAANGTLIDAEGTSRWGTSGSNGGAAVFTASGETLVGALTADSISSITATLKNSSTLTGATTRATLTTDSTSTWNVTAASTLTSLNNAGTIVLADLTDTITVTGTATLGGTLVLPPTTTVGTYKLLTAGSISGTFTSWQFSPSLATGLSASLSYSSTGVSVVVTGSVTTATGPTISLQPAGHTVARGHSASFFVEATASSGTLAYQWYKDGAAILGAISPQLLLNAVTASDDGNYTVQISDSAGSVTSSAAAFSTLSTDTPGRIINMSGLSYSGTGSDVFIIGFVLAGGTGGARPLLIRSMGPTLASLNVSGYMVDPTLSLIPLGTTTALATNDNWGGTTELTTAAATLGAYSFASTTSADAALLTTLPAGPYTVVCSGVNSTTGNVLAELYDGAPSDYSASLPRLINISARGPIGTATLSIGFVITGSSATTVLLRGVGPYLTTAGLSGAITNPKITLYRMANGTSTAIAGNDDWNGATTLVTAATQVGAATLTASKEAVLLITLDPGVYSFSVGDAGSATGQALIEAYEVP